MVAMRKIEAEHKLAQDYAKTLTLLRALKTGNVSLDQVVLTFDGWSLINVEIDKEPQCVTESCSGSPVQALNGEPSKE